MAKLLNTYQLIANILSFKSNTLELKNELENGDVDYDLLVKITSEHLILPTIYCRLKEKNILKSIPKDLEIYLEQITEINRNRNRSIIHQAKSISQLLDKHHIKYTFLKGTALLLGGHYKDLGERMIGDIDILIEKDTIDYSYELFKKEYYPIKMTLGDYFFESKHLPRLKTDHYICALELHKKLFNNSDFDGLSNRSIIKNRITIQSYYIPNKTHLFEHNILNHQINDKGYFYNGLNFRTSYDALLLIAKHENDIIKGKLKTRETEEYILRQKYLFKDFSNLSYKNSKKLFTHIHSNNLLRVVWIKTVTAYLHLMNILKRLIKLISNSNYRKAIWKDRQRIKALLFQIVKFEHRPRA
ncbi:nucleotidyltransferase family protein [Winogradskyella poriferorum]|uniref:nucleotidyltransferase family protein n=1 Tax=Winogradskyella poriferorum TaxID=307627 RepID=UPI003D647996